MYDGLHTLREEMVVVDEETGGKGTRLKASSQLKLVQPLRTQHTGSVLLVVACLVKDTDHRKKSLPSSPSKILSKFVPPATKLVRAHFSS